jgi:hypothetical protein
VAAAAVALTLLAMIACDLWLGGFRAWWNRDSLTGSIVSNLLVLAVAGLIVDDVVARRQRRERSVSVAVQGLIVFGQARRTCAAILSSDEEKSDSGAAADELRSLASMLLTASPNLFDDPAARQFLGQVERFSASMIHTVDASSPAALSPESRQRLTAEMSELETIVQPLLARIPVNDRALLEGPSEG